MALTPHQRNYVEGNSGSALQEEANRRARRAATGAVDTVTGLIPGGTFLSSITGAGEQAREAAAGMASGAVQAQGTGFFSWIEGLWAGLVSMIVRFAGDYLGMSSTNTAVGSGILASSAGPDGAALSPEARGPITQAVEAARASSPNAPPTADINNAIARAVADATMSTGSVASDAVAGLFNFGRGLFGYDAQRETPHSFGLRVAGESHAAIVRTFMSRHEGRDLTGAQRDALAEEALAFADRLTGVRVAGRENNRTVYEPTGTPATGLQAYFQAQATSASASSGTLPLSTTIALAPAPAAERQVTADAAELARLAALAEKAERVTLTSSDSTRPANTPAAPKEAQGLGH